MSRDDCPYRKSIPYPYSKQLRPYVSLMSTGYSYLTLAYPIYLSYITPISYTNPIYPCHIPTLTLHPNPNPNSEPQRV